MSDAEMFPGSESGRGLPLFTDLYELTMLQAYFEQSMHGEAVFSLYVRHLPAGRNFLVACGLQPLLRQLETLSFAARDLEYLAEPGIFSERFLAWLQEFRFTGDVYAVSEGTPLFADEPILEVVAPLPEAQLIETLVMNQVHFQTVLASKAVRVVTAAAGRPVIDLARRLGARFRVSAVRLDSGNLDRLSREARHMLDDAGLDKVQIFSSGGLDEHAIHALVAGEGRLKLSSGKPVLPGRKQVIRREDDTEYSGDTSSSTACPRRCAVSNPPCRDNGSKPARPCANTRRPSRSGFSNALHELCCTARRAGVRRLTNEGGQAR